MWTILSRPNCPWCDKAAELIHERDEEAFIQYYDVTKEENKWLRYLMLKAGTPTVPQVFDTEGQYIGGHTELVNHFFKGQYSGSTET